MSARDVIARYDDNLADGYGHIDAILSALTAAGYRIVPPGGLDAEQRHDLAIASLRRAIDLAEAMLTNDPNEPISDAGHTLLEWWMAELEKLRAALRSLIEEPTNDAR